jgi:uncharacterized protein YutE (UPF0331/DUF86 family)
MFDKERINQIIEDIEMYLKKLEDMNIKSINDLDDLNYYASSMILFSILNRAIDLGDEVVKAKKLGYPMEIKEIFSLLSDKKIIDKKLGEKMKDFVRDRNKFSHRYNVIEQKDILRLIREIVFVKEFISKIVEYIKREG